LLSTELAPHHILVNCVAPGWIETDMARPVLRNRRMHRQALSAIPLRRFGRPEEVAMPTFAEFADEFLKWAKANLAEATVKVHKVNIDRLK
jgi:NAD(P)-dependent dehydrogenase (short-subunit alcohol dehydrogenase family)